MPFFTVFELAFLFLLSRSIDKWLKWRWVLQTCTTTRRKTGATASWAICLCAPAVTSTEEQEAQCPHATEQEFTSRATAHATQETTYSLSFTTEATWRRSTSGRIWASWSPSAKRCTTHLTQSIILQLWVNTEYSIHYTVTNSVDCSSGTNCSRDSDREILNNSTTRPRGSLLRLTWCSNALLTASRTGRLHSEKSNNEKRRGHLGGGGARRPRHWPAPLAADTVPGLQPEPARAELTHLLLLTNSFAAFLLWAVAHVSRSLYPSNVMRFAYIRKFYVHS